MPVFYQEKSNFTAGEISRRLLGRNDLRAFDNGAMTLRNVFIHPTGGLTRRAGLAYVATARGAGRLISFEFNAEQTYLLAFSGGKIDVYHDDALVATVDAPWTESQLSQISWTQSADTLLICHPDVPPRKLTRTGETVWTLNLWSFLTEDNVIRQPYYKFAEEQATVTPSATSGAITVTASIAVFDPLLNGIRMRIGGKQIQVTGVVSATVVNATVIQTLTNTQATIAWDEQAFSARRGWPTCAAFHQDRLVIGGSRDLPNRLWLSRSSDLWNFDLGTGLDDEGIEFGILSDQVNAIRALFSGRHLQVFTSGAEWMVSGDPLTPQNIQLKRQTRIGMPADRTIPPRDVDGATLFISRNGRELREFLFTINEQAYQATDLAMLAGHLVHGPIDQDYDKGRRLLFVVMDDGSVGVLTIYRTEQVTAWTQLITDGEARSTAVVGDDVYVLVKRGALWLIERFDDTLNLDSALVGTQDVPGVVWSGLEHLEGRTVFVVADGVTQSPATVIAGKITLETPALSVAAGLPYTHIIEPLPPNLLSQGGGGRVRLVEALFRLEETSALRVDVGRGLYEAPLHRFGVDKLSNGAPVPFSGDRRLRALGWPRDSARSLWRIEQNTPAAFTLLSVYMELKVSD
ncbi:Peptidase_S9 domain-containing protein [Azospirillaceae bacterium]